jgi:acyl-CoA-binding protein
MFQIRYDPWDGKRGWNRKAASKKFIELFEEATASSCGLAERLFSLP